MGNLYGIHFGLNEIGFKTSQEIKKLRHAENDAKLYHSICQTKGGDSKLFLGKDATTFNFNDSIIELSTKCIPDDLLVISFSGHGSQIIDVNSDEEDSYDEILVFYDKIIIDDFIKVQFSRFVKGVNIFYITDSCYSGTVYKFFGTNIKKKSIMQEDDYIERGFDFVIAQEIFDSSTEYKILKQSINEKALTVSASIIHLSACQDDETAWDGSVIMKHGLLTHRLLKTWDNGNFNGSYEDFFYSIKSKMGGSQNPNLSFEGEVNTIFNSNKPFEKIENYAYQSAKLQ